MESENSNIIDLGEIKPSVRSVPITHPGTGDELPLVFHLRSPHHPEVKKVEREFQQTRLRKRSIDMSIEEFESLRIRTLVAHVEGWKWEDDKLMLDGEQPEFSKAACDAMLRKHVWIKDWLDNETGNASRFYQGLKKD